jgi:small subunit ribosomal protein S16
MLKIKLSRLGKNKEPHYRFVVQEAKEKRDGKSSDILGHYAPTQTPKVLHIDVERFAFWLAKGAQPTETVRALFERFKSGKPFGAKKKQLSKKAKAKALAEQEAKAAPAETPKPAVAQEIAPAETTPTETESAPAETAVASATPETNA